MEGDERLRPFIHLPSIQETLKTVNVRVREETNMHHPILSMEEFVRHFQLKAAEFGFDMVEELKLNPSEMAGRPMTQSAFGVVIDGEAVIGSHWGSEIRYACEEFQLPQADGFFVRAGPHGARVMMARRSLESDRPVLD
ncbi:MAG: hypothetical protein EBT24_03920 [Betaproteobacteria bacterium]|nr:hypothetical protein [Betaproteobacteria bacterium]